LEALADARAALERAEPFDAEHIEQALREVVEARDAKPRDVFPPVRVALAGTTVSPGIFETLQVLGRDEALSRIDAVLRT
jgi:glutamyl/glutaminyl-tRNA synthetase